MVAPCRPADIEAVVRFLTTAEDGRLGRVATGYRPHHAMGRSTIMNDAHHQFVDREFVELGERVKSRMWFSVPEYQFHKLFPGMEFTVHEGSKTVGHGRVIRVLNDAMKAETP
jgi:translation elongation factor EF-Tu-like GTPase